MWWRFIPTIVGLLVGAVGIAFGLDQQEKRESESAGYRAHLQALKARLSTQETQLADLRSRFGEKNEHVRALEEKVQRLRREVEEVDGVE